MAKGQSELAKVKTPAQANSDAVALADLQTLGIESDIDRLNKLLVLLAVLVVECGGGLALAVGMSLSETAGHMADTQVSGSTERPRTPPDTSSGHLASIAGNVQASSQAVAGISPRPRADTSAHSASSVRLLSFIREHGGVLANGQRAMAEAIGWSKSKMHGVLHDLASAGLVELTTCKAGTIVRITSAAA